ncbi:hypothetical protein YPPY103_1322, partial [Yersinia pestis PY-103]|jgi:hypothetical protein
MAVT